MRDKLIDMGFMESEVDTLINGDIVTQDNNAPTGSVEHQILEYRLQDNVVQMRSRGTASGCFWSDWQ
jgi:hypothetical protein